MAAVGAAALHIGVGGIVFVARGFGVAVGAFVSAVAMGPAAVCRWCAVLVVVTVAVVTTTSATATASSATTLSLSTPMAGVIGVIPGLGLEIGDGGYERLDLVDHGLVLLGSVRHVGELLFHLVSS